MRSGGGACKMSAVILKYANNQGRGGLTLTLTCPNVLSMCINRLSIEFLVKPVSSKRGKKKYHNVSVTTTAKVRGPGLPFRITCSSASAR